MDMKRRYNLNILSIYRGISLFIIPLLAYSLALIPPMTFLYFNIKFFSFNITHVLLFAISLMLSYYILILSLILSSAFFINVLNLRYEPGKYEQNLNEKTYLKYNLYFLLYYPTYRTLNFIVSPPVKVFYLKLIGAKIGKNVFLALDELIFDPCLTEIGDNTIIGSKSMILGHIGEDKLILRKTKIGKNCIIGTESLIMPGVTIEDNVVLGAKSFVTKNKILKKGGKYAGIPAREI
ncbi:MAG: hypothetical protein DRN12_00190 [Thermoplasmata archaeon]|nr:MAG: hypothetical protein DRN12_00190 [Thermoplasmata archaeon]